MADGSEHPFLVTMDYPKGKIVYLGSGKCAGCEVQGIFYESVLGEAGPIRAAGRRLQQNNRGTLVMGRQFHHRSFMRVEAQGVRTGRQPAARSVASSVRLAAESTTEGPARNQTVAEEVVQCLGRLVQDGT